MADFKLTKSDKYLAIYSRSKQILLNADEQRQTLEAILVGMSAEQRREVVWRAIEADLSGVQVSKGNWEGCTGWIHEVGFARSFVTELGDVYFKYGTAVLSNSVLPDAELDSELVLDSFDLDGTELLNVMLSLVSARKAALSIVSERAAVLAEKRRREASNAEV